MFDFGKVKEDKKLKFVGYGINDAVVVSDVQAGSSQNGTPFIQINVKYDGDEDKNSTTLKLYMSPKAQEISMRKILHLHQAMNKKELLSKMTAPTLEVLATKLKGMWVNRKFRLKLAGEEYVGVAPDGTPKTKVKLNIPFPPFAEPMNGMAETPAVTETKLTFDKSNKYDYKALDASALAAQATPVTSSEAFDSFPSDDSMPF